MFEKNYDVIVVGGGHAGAEATAAAANLGSKVLLITQNIDTICQMSCNPAMGGVAKGQIVREIDALGGYSGIVTDKTMIQFRMLNRSKGPAMWSPRAQSDKFQFSMEWRHILENLPNVSLWQDEVNELLVENNKVIGVKTKTGMLIHSKSVILTNGTFLNGIIHIGETSFQGGRIGEGAAKGLTENLKSLGFETARLKTGTPVRVNGNTINFSVLEEQKGDENPANFSFLSKLKLIEQRSCYLAYTSEEVHDILRKGFEKSPMFVGRIQGRGPRYCPSIEDKIERFSDKSRHQLFVEPEGRKSNSYYINGFSSSLPLNIQVEALRAIKGFENAEIFKPGYAIEYDYFPPTQLYHTLETKKIENLFFAGQINGTTGYEEAAAQGLIAGINAHLKIAGSEMLVLSRNQAYIGVLIDDLVSKGVDEPYRMFTSRSEYRILLRQDNADERLTGLSYNIGLASKHRYDIIVNKKKAIDELVDFIKNTSVTPDDVNLYLKSIGSSEINQKRKVLEIVSRPEVSLNNLINEIATIKEVVEKIENLSIEVVEEAEIKMKYLSYIEREQQLVEKMYRLETLKIPDSFNYSTLSITIEARQKLDRIRPKTIGQASRIPGISPADVSVLLVLLGR